MKRNRSRLSVCISALILLTALFVSPTIAYAQEPIARIANFVGEAFVRSQVSPPAGEWRRVTAVPVPLFSGDEVRTERGRAEIIYPNDDAVRLIENSSVRLAVTKEERRRLGVFKRTVNVRALSTSAGRIWASVTTDADNEVQFRSPVAVASIRGSKWKLDFQHDPGTGASFVGAEEVEKGKRIIVTGAAGVTGAVDLDAREATIIAAGRRPSRPFPYSPPGAPGMTAVSDATPPPITPPVEPASAPSEPSRLAGLDAGTGAGSTGVAVGPGLSPLGSFISFTPLLSDDTFISVPFTGGFSFPFFGTTYTSAFVGSNGYITFNSGLSTFNPSVTDLMAANPRATIATAGADPDPSVGGSVTINQFTNALVVNFFQVPSYGFGPSVNNTFTTTLFNDGRILMQYTTIDRIGGTASANDLNRNVIVGVSPGGTNAVWNPVDFASLVSASFSGPSAIFQRFGTQAVNTATFGISQLPRPLQADPDTRGGGLSGIIGTFRGSTNTGGRVELRFTSGEPGSFALVFPGGSQGGTYSFDGVNLNILTANTPTGTPEFIFFQQTIPVAFTAEKAFDLAGRAILFTPNISGGFDVTDPPIFPASPSA